MNVLLFRSRCLNDDLNHPFGRSKHGDRNQSGGWQVNAIFVGQKLLDCTPDRHLRIVVGNINGQ